MPERVKFAELVFAYIFHTTRKHISDFSKGLRNFISTLKYCPQVGVRAGAFKSIVQCCSERFICTCLFNLNKRLCIYTKVLAEFVECTSVWYKILDACSLQLVSFHLRTSPHAYLSGDIQNLYDKNHCGIFQNIIPQHAFTKCTPLKQILRVNSRQLQQVEW